MYYIIARVAEGSALDHSREALLRWSGIYALARTSDTRVPCSASAEECDHRSHGVHKVAVLWL